MTLVNPYVGVLMWSWFTLQQPHQEAYGLVQTAPLNFIIAIVTLLAWLLSNERKIPPAKFIIWMFVIFVAWMTINSFFAFDPAVSWPFWDRTWKTILLGLVIAATATKRTRVYSLVWIVVIALFYYGVKGGLFTILTGGNFRVFGPQASVISDNNQVAVALLMVLPLANYLRGQVVDKRIAHLLLAGMALTVIAIVGTYSRGALIGLGALGLFMLLRVRSRIFYVAICGLALLLLLNFMPEHFFDRAASISGATEDVSFEGRLNAWHVAFLYASEHFPFGAGFSCLQLPVLFHHYLPDQIPRAAHSIYFEVLGDNGFVGLGIYLLIIAAAFLTSARIIRASRNNTELRWACDLAVAIQGSLLVFCIAGAALSMAYYDLFIIDVAILLPLQEITCSKTQRAAWSPPRAALAP